MRELTGTVSVAEILAYVQADGYLSLPAAAQYLALSENSIRAQLDTIPHFRVGSRLKFRKSELDEWMSLHRVKTAADEVEEAVEGICG